MNLLETIGTGAIVVLLFLWYEINDIGNYSYNNDN